MTFSSFISNSIYFHEKQRSTTIGDELKWNGEVILADALQSVLKNLNTVDLCCAAQVCKSWNHAVQLEFSRRGPERILFPNPIISAPDSSKIRLGNIFSSKPNLVILFYVPDSHPPRRLNMEVDTGTRLVLVGVDKAVDDTTEILGCPTLSEKFDPFDILGLALPLFRNAKIDVAYCASYERGSVSLAQQVVQKLTPEISDQNIILILLGRFQYSVSDEVLKIIKSTWKNHTYALWGGTTLNYLKIISCGDGDFPSYMGMQGAICIKIVAQGLEAYSTAVSWTLKRSVIKDKLLKFKRRLKLRRHKLGLACGSCTHLSILIEIIKEVFPDIPFTSFFNDDGQYFALDSNEDTDQVSRHAESMSMMILTYD